MMPVDGHHDFLLVKDEIEWRIIDNDDDIIHHCVQEIIGPNDLFVVVVFTIEQMRLI